MLPRYAANLSFNPLQPLKPQQVQYQTTPKAEMNTTQNDTTSQNTAIPDVLVDGYNSSKTNGGNKVDSMAASKNIE